MTVIIPGVLRVEAENCKSHCIYDIQKLSLTGKLKIEKYK